jgi:hypothetical protein
MKNFLLSILILFTVTPTVKAQNRFVIDSINFNTDSFKFRVVWHTDSTAFNQKNEFGINVSCGTQQNSPPFSHTFLKSLSSDTVFTIPDLMFDTTYFIGIWGYSDGIWYSPDTLSIRKIDIHSSNRQPVCIFNPTKVNDTIKALDGEIILWKDSNYPLGIPPHLDTVIKSNPPDSLLSGFIRLSPEIRFSHPEPSLPFYIALQIDSIPEKCKSWQIHIYRDSSNLFIPEINSFVNKEKSYVILKTANLDLPLIVLADTTPPSITHLSKSTVIDSATLYDTIVVSDNSANSSFTFFCSPGSEIPDHPSLSGKLKGCSGRIICPIPASGAQDFGIRAFLILSDGTYIDTIDFSKQGRRYHSDPFLIPEKTIVPVYTTAKLDNYDIKSCLKPFFDQTSGNYERSKFRIFRWLPQKSNSVSTDKWVEYSSENEDNFTFSPGILFWVICNETRSIDLGKGVTASLTDTFSIKIPSKNWSDFNDPFSFNLSVSDVIRNSVEKPEDLTIYKWIEDSKNHSFRADLVYNNAVTPLDSLNDTLYARQNGYTVYNHTSETVSLKFPPFPCKQNSLESYPLNKSHQNRCLIKVKLNNGDQETGAVYCGIHSYTPDTISVPLPPSFDGNSIVLGSQTKKDSFGILSYPYSNNNFSVFNIDITSKDKSSVNISVDELAKMQEVNYSLFTKNENEIKPLSSRQVSLNNGRASLILVAGSANAIEMFQYGHINHQLKNPSVRMTCSQGKLHLNMKNIENSICSFEMYTLQGQKISSGKFEYTGQPFLSIPVHHASGIYFIKVIFKNKNSTVFSLSNKVSFVNEGI